MSQNEINQLEVDYHSLCERLEALGREGDDRAREMRRFFSEADDAWHNDDGDGAKSLSEKGRVAQARSEAANAEARDIRQIRNATLDRLKAARQELPGRAVAPATLPSTAPAALTAHGAQLIGFDRTHGWSASTVGKFLEHLSPRPFAEIGVIEYLDVVDTNHKAGETENLHDRSRKVDIKIYRPPVDLTGNEFNRYQAETLVHEYGHVVLDRVVAPEVLHGWKEFWLDRRKDSDSAWITKLARTSAREDFSECLVAYLLRSKALRQTDLEKYDRIKEIYEGL